MSVSSPAPEPTPVAAETAPAEPAAPVAAPVPAAPPAAPAGDGPWASDLASLFPDEAQRGVVDSFLRAKVQPYTTQLEQQAAASKDAVRLFTDLSQSPVDTYVALTEELFGEQASQALLGTLQQQLAENSTPTPTTQEPPTAMDPRMEEALSYIEEKRNKEFYDAEMARITAAGAPAAGVDEVFLAPFVAAAGGNFDEAASMYSHYQAQQAARNALTPAAPAAPPVMGSDTTAPSTPPVAPRNQTLDEAINDFMAENRANAQAPPVA